MQQIHSFNQGSDAWLRFRADHFGSSEASAMLGISKLTSRTELLTLKHTGVGKEFSDFVQREILDKGHSVEALARPIVEKMIGEELSPVTASIGKLSASSDGVTFMGDIGWENKQYNKEHFEQVKNGVLPDVHWPQCQQVIMVHGLEKLFFTISDGTEENTVGVWVHPDKELQSVLVNGWNQFEKDLANFVPVEIAEKPKAAVIMALPSLAIQIKGEVVQSNLADFKRAATVFIANIKTDLVTDEDFSNAEAMVKFCKTAEENIEITKKAAIAQTSSIDDLMRTMDFIKAELSTKRLALDKLVKEQKLSIKVNAISKAKADWAEYLREAEKEMHPIRLNVQEPKFADVISGLKTIKSMHSNIGDAIANGKIIIDAAARDIREKQNWYKEFAMGYEALFADLQQIIMKPKDDFQLVVKSRMDAKEKEDEAKYQKIKQDAEIAAREKIANEAAETARLEQAKLDAFATEQAHKDDIAEVGKVIEAVQPISKTIIATSTGISIKATPIYFSGANPSANEIICALAEAFHADEALVHKWLIEADFVNLSFKKAA